MAGEAAYEGAVRAMLDCEGIDVILVSAVPLTPALMATVEELPPGQESLAEVLARLMRTAISRSRRWSIRARCTSPSCDACGRAASPCCSADQAMGPSGLYLRYRRPEWPMVEARVRRLGGDGGGRVDGGVAATARDDGWVAIVAYRFAAAMNCCSKAGSWLRCRIS